MIEYYHARWTIEDWHKVLKTGYEIEERQPQTWERMEVLLSIYSVIAWKVLELRELARGEPSASPDVLLSEAERSILETKLPELSGQNGQAYAVSVALSDRWGHAHCYSERPLTLVRSPASARTKLHERLVEQIGSNGHRTRQIYEFTDYEAEIWQVIDAESLI